jgi:nucleoside-diphosphate-sugar epimerase
MIDVPHYGEKIKILLTGATGFIGSHVARLLVNQEGCEVHALVREHSNPWRIQDILPSLHLWRSDLGTSTMREYLLEIQPDLCIHLAWYTEPGKYLQALENLDSLASSLELVTQLAAVGCRRFVGIGTCAEYDFSLGYLSESSPIKPFGFYAATKAAFSTILPEFSQITGMEIAWLRLFYLYGPGEDERRLVAGIITSLLRDEVIKTTKGEQIKDFLHVEDSARAIWAVARSNLQGVINIGSGQPVTVKEIAYQLGNLLGKSSLIDLGALPYRPQEPMFVCANNHLLKENTDWIQQYELLSGLESTIDWYQQRIKREQNAEKVN